MRRFFYGMFAMLALPCSAAEPSGYQEWLQFKQEFAEEAGGPTGMYAIQDMIELSAGESAHLPANQGNNLRWTKTAPSVPLVTVTFSDQRAMVGAPHITARDLFGLPDKTLSLGNGLAVKATLLREKTLKVWLYDAGLPERRKFKGLEYFPYDPKGRITAPFHRNDKPVAVTYLDSREQAGTMYEVGVIDAVIDGKPQQLKTFSYHNDWKDIDALLLLLRDRTSGKTTYGGGRVVDISIPKGAPPPTVTFDLNMAYSFLCAHSNLYNCPLMLTNRLDADLTYGEKYPPKIGDAPRPAGAGR
jgi:uncharacterized protein (DUF1684 family)